MNTIGIGALVLFEGVGHPKIFSETRIKSAARWLSSRVWHKLVNMVLSFLPQFFS